MKIKKIREAGSVLGREKLAIRVLEIAKEIIEDGSYKRAIRGAGQMKVVAKACGFDEYWDEKAMSGEINEEYNITQAANREFEENRNV
jgi:hypothetical protein